MQAQSHSHGGIREFPLPEIFEDFSVSLKIKASRVFAWKLSKGSSILSHGNLFCKVSIPLLMSGQS